MITEEFNWKTTDGLTLQACNWQPEADLRGVVCLVHGLGEHLGRYRQVAAYFTNAGIGVLSFDLRGHGKSQGKQGYIPSYDILLDDVQRLLTEAGTRYPAKPIFLYGHSLGGNLVINYALRRKPSLIGVISTSPFLHPGFNPPASKLALGKIMYSVWPGFTMPNGLELQALSKDPRVVDAYINDRLVHNHLSARLGLDMLKSGEWAMNHAAELSVPLLLMHGDADRLTSASASREFARGAGEKCTLKIWDGGYHELHNEPEQREVLGYMLNWMEARL